MNRYCIAGLALVLAVCCVCAKAESVVDIAYRLAHKELGGVEWQKFVRATMQKYETWSSDNNDAPLKRYLDDKLVEIAPGVLDGDVKALKKLVCWVALYREFHEPPHTRVLELALRYRRELQNLLEDFSWERAAAAIRDRHHAAEKAEKIEKAEEPEAPERLAQK